MLNWQKAPTLLFIANRGIDVTGWSMAIFSKGKLEQLEFEERVHKRHTILIVDDEDSNLVSMSSVLQDNYHLLVAQGGHEALDIVKQMDNPESISLVISDQRMPSMTGVMLFQELAVLIPKTVRIIVTGYIDVEAIIDSVNKAHIYRFILKPFERAELLRIITKAIETYEVQQQRDEYLQNLEAQVAENTQQLEERKEELDRAYKSLEALRQTDHLTKLNSRWFLLNHLEADLVVCLKRHLEWNHSDKSQPLIDADMAFFIIDIDHFTQVNEQYGENAGDQVLMQIRSILVQVFRESDFLVRWNEDELLVVARFIDRTEAVKLAEKLRQAFEHHDFNIPDQETFHKTCSIGFACFPFERIRPQAVTWMQLIDISSACLNAAKNTQDNAWIGAHCRDNAKVDDVFHSFMEDPSKMVEQQVIALETSIDAKTEIKWIAD